MANHTTSATGSWRNGTLDRPDGASIALYAAIPDSPKAIVHIHHGMAEHAGRYARFAEALVAEGYGAYAHDHRGHGRTKGSDMSLGLFSKQDGWEAVLDDALAVNAHIRAENPTVPIVCFGHSMGSIIAFNFILRHADKVAGAALWNSGVKAGGLARVFSVILKVQRFFKGSDVPSNLARKATFDTWNKEFAPNRTEFDWLSRDEAEVDAYIADPLCGFPVTIGLWLDVLQGVRFAADDGNLARLPADLPVHLLAGEQDPCSEHGKAVENIADRMNAQGMSDVTLKLLTDTRHESLNELNRDQTTADFIAWLDARFG